MTNRETLTLTTTDEQAEAIVAIVDATPQAEHYFDLNPGGEPGDRGLLLYAERVHYGFPPVARRLTITDTGAILTATGPTDLDEIRRWHTIVLAD